MAEPKKHICYNCGKEEYKIIHKGVRDNDKIDVLRCSNCGLVFLSDDSHIESNFYENGGMIAGFSLENWIKNTKTDDKRRFLLLKKRIKDKIVTDFGCGNAGFLNFAKDICKKVYGIELQKDLYDYFKTCGLDIFSKISLLPEKSDIITMFHVLEHTKNPVDTLKELKPFLNKNGSIIIEVPNAKDSLISFYKCKSFEDFVYWSCHLFVFDKNTLKQTIKKAGYKIKKFSYIQRYSFMNNLYWLLKKKPGGHKIWAKYDFKAINTIYSFFLKLFGITDTMLVEIVPD